MDQNIIDRFDAIEIAGTPKTIRVGGKAVRIGSILQNNGIIEKECVIVGDSRPMRLRVASDESDDVLIERELGWLTILRGKGSPASKVVVEKAGGEKFYPYFPEVVLDFDISGRKAFIVHWRAGFRSVKEVFTSFPDGVDPRAVAWMYKRMLAAAGYAHCFGIICCSILPLETLIHPDDHGLLLKNWTRAMLVGTKVQSDSSTVSKWCPPELKTGDRVVGPGTDIWMASKMASTLLGSRVGDVVERMRAFLRGAMIANPARRPDNAWELHTEFDKLLHSLFGPPKWIPFEMPNDK